MQPRALLNGKTLSITVERLCYELLENHGNFSESAIIGLQPRGIYLARRIHQRISQILQKTGILMGEMDVTFYRDDFRRRESPLLPQSTNMNFVIENKKVILIDDVLFTGRTVRSGLDALLSYGRPRQVELLVLIDRRWSRQLPIQPEYVGKTIDTLVSQKVKVLWKETDGEDKVVLYSPAETE